MATQELQCEKHHTPTHLTCAQCGKPACTKCLVWTEVGQKCRDCVPGRGGSDRNPIIVPALLVGVLVIVLLFALGVFSNDSKTEVPKSANKGTTQPGIGQPARDGGMTFLVKRFDCGAEDVGQGPGKRTALGRYCLLEFRATNTGTQPTAFQAPGQFLLDAQHRRFAPDPAASTTYQRTAEPGSNLSLFQPMNPGAEVNVVLVYDIPDGVNPEVAELHTGNNSLGVTVRLTESAGRTQS